MSVSDYIPVIGLEIHSELLTKSKVFCTCSAEFGGERNTRCCPVCSGMPGTLPVINQTAVEYAVRAGYALGCSINKFSVFDRKNYFYPDLPKAYQISQMPLPLCINGVVPIDYEENGEKKHKEIRINRIHLEEDAGKLIHDDLNGVSLCDYNRCGASTSASYYAGGSYGGNASITLYAIWSCPHSATTQTFITSCDWQRVCNNCGAVTSTGTTHGPYSYSAWEYYSMSQHMRYKSCNHGDYSVAQYQGHSLSTKFEQYTDSQHKYYSYCSVCDSIVGSKNTEAHSFTSTERGGSIIYTCSECGYSCSVKKIYTVTFNANGGVSAPSSQTKIHGETLTLTTAIPTREGYDFLGWATSSSMAMASYAAGGSYTSDADITLYAVWEKTVFTVFYNANGGSGAPAAQTKTIGETVTISKVQPTRTNYAFMGWATSSMATTPEYYGGESYSADASVTLYAVWVERNYDFSVSGLEVTPNEVLQYERVNVYFRIDSWDRNLAYSDIPVEVLFNGAVIYSTTVDIAAYGVKYIDFNLNVGASEGEQTLVARVNWLDYNNETRTDNNSVSTTFQVKKAIETAVECVPVSGEYIEGMDVISSFYVRNEGSSDVTPADHLTFTFKVYSTEKTVFEQTKTVVIPANGTNIVYFKWTVPLGSAGTVYWCNGTVSASEGEQNTSNNSTEFAIVSASLPAFHK